MVDKLCPFESRVTRVENPGMFGSCCSLRQCFVSTRVVRLVLAIANALFQRSLDLLASAAVMIAPGLIRRVVSIDRIGVVATPLQPRSTSAIDWMFIIARFNHHRVRAGTRADVGAPSLGHRHTKLAGACGGNTRSVACV